MQKFQYSEDLVETIVALTLNIAKWIFFNDTLLNGDASPY